MKKVTLKKINTWLIATLASASIIVAASYEAPVDIVKDDDDDDKKNHITIVESRKKQSVVSKTVERIPVVIRMLFMIPMWFAGTLLLKLLEPFKKYLVSALATFIILALIVFLIAKLLFPDLKLKDIFTKKTLIILVVASLIIPLVNFTMSITIDDYLKYVMLTDFIIGIIVLMIILVPLAALKRKISSIMIPDENI